MCGIPDVLYTDHGSDLTSRHLEQVGADLRIRLVFSLPGKPRGRGRIERLFSTVNEMFLCELDGYAPAGGAVRGKPTLTLADFEARFRTFLLDVYHRREKTPKPKHRQPNGGKPMASCPGCQTRWSNSTYWMPPDVHLPQQPLNPETVATIIRMTGGNFRLLNRLLTQMERILEINALQEAAKCKGIAPLLFLAVSAIYVKELPLMTTNV